jgi:hypothetical protein
MSRLSIILIAIITCIVLFFCIILRHYKQNIQISTIKYKVYNGEPIIAKYCGDSKRDDGDTVTMCIGNKIFRVRLRDIYTAETHKKCLNTNVYNDIQCECEIEYGEIAKEVTISMLKEARKITLVNYCFQEQNCEHDIYGRVLSEIIIDNTLNLGKYLLITGLAFDNRGIKTSSQNWCKALNSFTPNTYIE